MTSPNRFWNAFYELVVHGYLLQMHCQRAAEVDRKVKIILAVASTSSLGIWAIFKVYPTLWAGIIVATQIVTATAKYLPYSSRLKASAACFHDYRDIQNWAEAKWCDIADGELTETQITKARVELQSKISKALKNHFPLDGLPKNKQLTEAATVEAEQYLSNHFGDI
ncbi:hypothetical protein H8K33_08100 [Undibacterium amnicola]|uniref:SMODS and SLOG-associating 2TM effector domain-containing protein n=1 Tax=Undibacterium amnicola TaxID=1834038 RepID=A0ABR6XQ55_9BURK|nr:hypothetical protein [Undibacterium amnicola]MBC3831468.1 hypothetical protein [Undibacterium amnicola]